MSSNSLQFKGLQHGKSLEALSFLNQSVNSKNPKRERESSLAYTKHRKRYLQIFLFVFCSVLSNNLMAQTGNSCSNPYVMNLTNGAGNAEFQFHYPDTVMYLKVLNISDKQIFSMQIDSLAILDFKKISIINSNCLGNYIYDVNMNSSGNKNFNFKVDFNSDIDTILIVLQKLDYNPNCSGCDTLLLKFKLLVDQIQGGTQPCNAPYPNYCKNLLLNAGFELHIPTLMPLDNVSGGAWEELQFDNQVCEWFPALPSPLTSPDYYTSYWNGYAPGAPNCSFCASHSLTSNQAWCNDPLPQSGNPFFDGINEAYAGVYSWHLSPSPEILRGQLDPDPANQLIQNHIYYIEGNFAQPHGIEYYGHMEIDVTNQANFIQANYNAFTTGIEISFDAFDYDAANPWRKFYNVFTSNGDETNIFIGNLTQKVTTPQSAGTTPTCTELLTASIPYMLFDNIVVKEFLADAGGPTVSVCNNVPTMIGGSCHYPNVQYNWQPANLFNNNTLSNPTITTNVNVICTLTVTITMPDNSTATTPPAYVNVEVYQSPIINILGSNSIPIYTSTALTATGAVSYSWVGTNGTSGTGATFNTGALTQQETFTVTAFDANGCSAVESFVLNVTNMGGYCDDVLLLNNLVIIPDGYTSTQLKNDLLLSHPSNITMASNNGNGSYTYNISSTVSLPLTFILAGTFTIDNVTGLKFNFANNFIGTPPPPNYSNFYCFDGSNIINNSYLTMTGCSLVACNNMWKGITNNKNLYLNGCYFADAEYAVHLANGSNYKISTNVFDNNLYGILMGGIGGGQITGVDYSNLFTSTNPLKPAFPTMFFHPTWSEAGIKVHNVNYVQIGAVPAALANFGAATISNRFENINCGINIFNSNVNVVNSWFKNITVMNPSPSGTLIGLKPEGTGVYARSIGNPKTLTVQPIPGYTGYEFENCGYGIKTYRNSVRAHGLSMKTLKYGFDLQNSINCNYQLKENDIEAYSLAGIFILGAHNASSINLGFNHISSNTNANKGIRVSGTLSGGIAGNCYIGNNIVQVGADASGGIEVSGMLSPTIQSNHVKKEMYYLTWGNTYGFKGYNFSACDDALVNCNYVTRSINGGTNIGSDYQFNLSTNSFIKCNNSGASPYGFDFRGPQAGTIFRTNTMGNHSIGLYVGTSGVIGPQPANLADPYEGNKWTGSYSSGFGAKNLTVNPTNVAQHLFLSNSADGSTYNPTVNPSYWFDITNQNPLAPCNILNCPQFRSPLIGNMGFYQAIANRTLITSDYPVESLWMLQGTLYEYLTKDPSLLLQNDSLALFYYNPMLEGIKGLKNIKDTLKKGAIDLLPFYAALHGNDSLMQDKAIEIAVINEAIVADTLNDSILIYQQTIKMAQYLLLQQSNEAIYQSINEMQEQVAQAAYARNQALEPGNVNEAIEKDINEIYLRTMAIGLINFSASDIQLLHKIALLCPLAAGPAVYRARDMYALINDTLQYSDSAVCAFEGYFRESTNVLYPALTKKENQSNYFKALPNPASERVLFTFKANDSTSDLTIYNLSGNIIYSTVLNANTNQLSLDISNFAKGVYIAHVVNTKTSSRIKFIVN